MSSRDPTPTFDRPPAAVQMESSEGATVGAGTPVPDHSLNTTAGNDAIPKEHEVAIEPGGTHVHASQERSQETPAVAPENDEQRDTQLPRPGSPTCNGISLNSISTVFYDCYQQLGDIDHLERAIMIAEEALDIVNLPSIQGNLSRCLGCRYERCGDLSDLARALEHGSEAVRGTADGENCLAERLGNLGHLYHARYQQLDDMDDLERAIENAEAAFEASILPDGNDVYAFCALDIWSSCVVARFERTEFANYDPSVLKFPERLSTIAISLDHLDQAVRTDHERVTQIIHHYGNCLINYHILGGPAIHVETAIRFSEFIIPASGHPKRAERLDDVAKRYYIRHDMNSNISDLEKCLEYAHSAVLETPVDHPLRATRLNALSLYHCARFKCFGSIEDLNLAISHASNAQEAISPEHPQVRKSLVNLSMALQARYERFGNLEDLEVAIQKSETALASTPDDDLGHRKRCLNNLALHLGSRYDRLGALKDLEATIAYAEENLKVILKGPSNPAGYLCNLAKRYSDRYKRLRQPADRDLAIHYGKVALVATKKDHPHRPTVLSNLAGHILETITTKAEALDKDEEALLDEVLGYVKEAVGLLQHGDPNLPASLMNLANSFKKRGIRNVSFPDLMAALEHEEKALAQTPHDHPERAIILNKIATSIFLRSKMKRSPSDERLAHSMYIEAWNCLEAHPLTRIDAARNAVIHLPSVGAWNESSSMLENAVRLMPQLSLVRSLERDDQEVILGELYGLSALAAASTLEAGKDPAHALGLLEMGRGILSGSVMDTRTGDLDRLRNTHPHLFGRFTRLQRQLSGPLGHSLEPDPTPLDKRNAWREFEGTLNAIRAIPEYREFLLPSTSDVMRAAVQDGTVVVVNCTQLRSDAIIVSTSDITSIPLPNLAYRDMKSQMGELPALLRGPLKTYASRNKALSRILRWLWKVAVEDILKVLLPTNSKKKRSSSPPRIWWIGTGEMSIAPFHAAGIHTGGSTKNTMSRVCSSYIPTIKALAYARQNKFTLNVNSRDGEGKPMHKILLATMPTTPDHAPLPSVDQEVSVVNQVVGKELELTILNQPGSSEVIKALPDYDVVHFACHGLSDQRNPSKSSLVLLDPSSRNSGSPAADHLTVQSISDARIERAQLAYLSACSTADNTATNLGDETIHLASAFQLAGFTHVVANLWQSKDDACMQVAGDFYRTLFNDKTEEKEGNSGHERVSFALHGAVARLREKMPKSPLVWAPFIHTGA